MELIEIRNNLIKLSYRENERPTLGHFIALTGEDKSYVAQFVNLKADNINNFAVAKLMFSFTSDGIVNDYDGSAPSINSNIVKLPVNELLSLLPIDTPIRIGQVTGCPDFFDVDISIFEHNFTLFCDSNSEKTTFISNCVRQLFRMKEKSVIIDKDSLFEEYQKIVPGEDFKLPLNSDFINFIFDYELSEIDTSAKAVIQDIFYAVQQYIKTLEDGFIPIDNFIEVVTAQYKETQMPELALLKNKLLKYSDSGIFANDISEFKKLEEIIKGKNCIVISVKNLIPKFQKEIITYVHKVIETFDKYVYYFVPVADDNTDKKLLQRLLNHNHVFTIFISGHNYKYASELKSQAQDVMFFAPQTIQNDFAAYNTFLNKLNPSEGVIYGKLTQNIPLIISLEDMDLDLTKDDVFGDKQIFVPAEEEDILTSDDIYAINNLQENPDLNISDSYVDDSSSADERYEETENNSADNQDEQNTDSDYTDNYQEVDDNTEDLEYNNEINQVSNQQNESEEDPNEEEHIDENDSAEDDNTAKGQYEETEIPAEDNDLSFMNDFVSDNDENNEQGDGDISESTEEDLTEEDLDFIDSENQTQLIEDDNEKPPVVPVYEADDDGEINEYVGYSAGDRVVHPKFGEGVVEKIKKYGNKTLCSIDFENIGRRLLDPSVSDLEKI